VLVMGKRRTPPTPARPALPASWASGHGRPAALLPVDGVPAYQPGGLSQCPVP